MIKFDSRMSLGAFDLIVAQEIGSDAEYDPHPDWPTGASGVTFGIGYDAGYHTVKEIITDWGAYFTGATLQRLTTVAGITGYQAKSAAMTVRDLTIPLDIAKQEFSNTEIPRMCNSVEDTFPNAHSLPPDAFGALASLGYNRGFNCSNTPTRVEMFQIREAMRAQQFSRVPGLIRAMKRLWEDNHGLVNRREKEAQLFEVGLASLKAGKQAEIPTPSVSIPSPAPELAASLPQPSTPTETADSLMADELAKLEPKQGS